ncbi:response regulator [Algoriphagus formosus]|uniref:response regulator n=1 Tax=Algoriphagus formosus TaxID=2007308 RepID=UPI000C284C23|nr:response regulator [Algoriphagus formosus]
MNVLIVDDEVDLCKLLSLQLKSLGLDSEYVNSISEAKEKYRPGKFDLIFLDLNLKDGSGFEMLNYLKQFKSTPRVIVISAYDAERSQVLKEGADYFLPKPFSKKNIAEIIDSF